MSPQWVAILVSILIAAISITTGIYQSGQSKNAATSSEKARADIAGLTIQILDRIDAKLDDYVRQQNWKDYKEAHAKEHFRIEEELTRLRDWKHNAEAEMRAMNVKIEDLGGSKK